MYRQEECALPRRSQQRLSALALGPLLHLGVAQVQLQQALSEMRGSERCRVDQRMQIRSTGGGRERRRDIGARRLALLVAGRMLGCGERCGCWCGCGRLRLCETERRVWLCPI